MEKYFDLLLKNPLFAGIGKEELRSLLAGQRGVLVCREGETLLLACPWEKRQPFPLVPLFCFARLRCVGSRYFLVFAFEGERPAFYEQEKSGEN